MFKKSLAALAIGAAFTGSAFAADVTLYGILDTGLVYLHESEHDVYGDKTNENSFTEQSGYGTTSRWGIKGTEELGNGMTVGFVLENGFEVDNGSSDNDGRLFGREASLTLAGNFGQISFGRMGGVGSSAGTYDLVYSMAEVFDGGDYNVWGVAHSGRYDNMLTYQTPEFAGLQATFQYSFDTNAKSDADGDEGHSHVDRYASAALTGNYGKLQLVAAAEWMNWASGSANSLYGVEDSTGAVSYYANRPEEDGQIYYLGGNYDCGFAKTFFLAQYFKGQQVGASDGALFGPEGTLDDIYSTDGAEGYGLHLGTIFNALGGEWTVGLYYVDGKLKNTAMTDTAVADDIDINYMGISGRYTYYLSKRTSLYLGAGFSQTKLDTKDFVASDYKDDYKYQVTQVYTGITHTF